MHPESSNAAGPAARIPVIGALSSMLSRVPLRLNLLLMLLVPAVGTVGLATHDLQFSLAHERENAELLELTEIVVRASDLVHQLQRERGLSAGYLGSNGTRFDGELSAQYDATNTRIATLDAYLATIDQDTLDAGFARRLEAGLAQLDAIRTLRPRIRGLDVATPEVIASYSRTNGAFLQLIDTLPTLSSVGSIASAGVAYGAFLQSKERAGIERAVLANTFAQDTFAPGTYPRFLALVTAQDVYLDSFRTHATADQADALDALLAAPAVAAAQAMRDAANARATSGGFEIDAGHWFNRQTEKIELLARFEDQLSSDLRSLAASELAAARLSTRTALIATIGPLLVALLVCWIIASTTLRRLGADPRRLEAVMTAIARDELDLDLDTGEPLTGVYAAAATMQQTLRDRIRADRVLLAENGRVRAALENVSGLVMIAGKDGKVLFANAALRRYFGRIRAGIAATTGLRVADPIGVPVGRLHSTTQVADGTIERCRTRQDGRIEYGEHTVDYVANPVLGEGGERLGTVIEWRDRTAELAEQDRVDAELAENRRIREALLGADAMVMIADARGEIAFANAALSRFFEDLDDHAVQDWPFSPKAGPVGQPADLLHGTGTANFFERIDSAHQGRLELGPHSIDYTANPVRDPEGQRIGTVFEWRDRTQDLLEAVRIREELAENGRVRAGLVNVSGLVMIAGEDDEVRFANHAMRAFLKQIREDVTSTTGLVLDDPVGTSIARLHGADARAAFSAGDEQTTGRVVFGTHTVDYVANAVLDDTGRRLGTVVEWRDRTAELAEAERTQLELAENGRVREALLNAGTLVMIADEADEIVFANAAMSDFFAQMASARRGQWSFSPATGPLGQRADAVHEPGRPGFFAELASAHTGRLELAPFTIDYVASPVRDPSGRKIGTVFEWRDRTRELAEEARVQETLTENGRIREALTNTAGNVFIAGPDGRVVFANRAALQIFERLRSHVGLAAGSASSLVGASVDQLHRGDTAHAGPITAAAGAREGQLRFGPFTIDYVASPVTGPNGEKIGTVVEWADRTVELAVGQELQSVVDAALRGDLTRRVDVAGKEGFFAVLAGRVNALVEIAEDVVDDTARMFGAIARGDLTQTIERDYEGTFGQLKADANATIEQLTDIVFEIQNAAGSVRLAAQGIASGNQDLSQRTESQATSLEETASSIEEMTSSVESSAQRAQLATTSMDATRVCAERGGAVVEEAVTAMDAIHQSSRKIADIVTVINDIAVQTNLLALNASVEAARAGEKGQGFAVVAQEVRSLAGHSANAASEIKELIKDSVERVSTGSELVNRSGEALAEIVQSVSEMNEMIGQISTASAEQAEGIKAVNRSVSQIDALTRQNAGVVRSANEGSRELLDQADGLGRLMEFFTLDAPQAGHAPRPPRQTRDQARHPSTQQTTRRRQLAHAS